MIRLALYYVPDPASPLALAAASWLGRDERSGNFLGQPAIPSLTGARLREMTRAPFHYGFHGTIKPPFQLAPGISRERVMKQLEEFAAGQKKFALPPLELGCMDNFFCLRPKVKCQELNTLAERAVRDFDHFRKPPSAEELQRRRGAGLSAGQEAMLTAWGYPYVMEEFRFHLTLTGRICDPLERSILKEELNQRFPSQLLDTLLFDSICLMVEIDHAPLVLVRRIALS